VDVGAGVKILGPITIGDDVSIGANAVSLTDIAANSIAVGIPARILPRSDRAAATSIRSRHLNRSTVDGRYWRMTIPWRSR
jgi:serine O-acetyltransferase